MIKIALFSIGISAFFGVVLTISAKKWVRKVDPKIELVDKELPGLNCGGCGFAGCAQFAEGVVADPELVGKCVVATRHAKKKIAKLLGVEHKSEEKKIARVLCKGGNNCLDLVSYEGVKSCAACKVAGGFKQCSAGCFGFGDCVQTCKFDALKIVNDVAVVDFEKCVGCGACVKACPQMIIKLQPKSQEVAINCSSNDSMKEKAKYCKTDCMGCGICARSCPSKAIEMVNNLAIIDYDKCINCGVCVAKCPRKNIDQVKQSK